uniref:RRM domain-containing protein n=1 Tax=Timema monikensis TaxID=170555 RepID=A0A7R9E113_9NEOP|nr:unnamed protein product [Timema monikensis]
MTIVWYGHLWVFTRLCEYSYFELELEIKSLEEDSSQTPRKRWESAWTKLKRAHEAVAKRYNQSRYPVPYKVGNKVVYRVYQLSRVADGIAAKLCYRWFEPTVIERLLTPVTVQLKDPETGLPRRKAHFKRSVGYTLNFPRPYCLTYTMLHPHVNQPNYFFSWEKTLRDLASCACGDIIEGSALGVSLALKARASRLPLGRDRHQDNFLLVVALQYLDLPWKAQRTLIYHVNIIFIALTKGWSIAIAAGGSDSGAAIYPPGFQPPIPAPVQIVYRSKGSRRGLAYGEIVCVNLVRDKTTGKSKGFCFLCYEDQRSTILAVDNLNGTKLLSRTIRVDHVAEYKVPKEAKKDKEKV